MSKKQIGYDETKRMLNILRKFDNSTSGKSKSLREQQENPTSNPPKDDIVVINDVDVKVLTSDSMGMGLSEDQKNSISNIIDLFRQQVSDLVEFEPGMTINQSQIRLDGVIPNLDFRFTLVAGDETGLYIISNMTKVTPELIDLLSKFNRYYQTYIDGMNDLITQRKNN